MVQYPKLYSQPSTSRPNILRKALITLLVQQDPLVFDIQINSLSKLCHFTTLRKSYFICLRCHPCHTYMYVVEVDDLLVCRCG